MAKVLLVEDGEICALVLRHALERAGHEVVVAATVSEARQRSAEQGFDVALVDVRLPDGEGTTLQLPCPRIMMSADPEPGVIEKSRDPAPMLAALEDAIGRPAGSRAS